MKVSNPISFYVAASIHGILANIARIRCAGLAVLSLLLVGCPMSFVGSLTNHETAPITISGNIQSDAPVVIKGGTTEEVRWYHCTRVEHDGSTYYFELQDFPEPVFQPESRFASRTVVNGVFQGAQLRLAGKDGTEFVVPGRTSCTDVMPIE